MGGGAGNQSIPLAVAGYDLTIVDPSPAMLARAEARAAEAGVAQRVRLVEATGADAPSVLGGQRFGSVLCHGILMYLEEPESTEAALVALADTGAIVSIVAKNVEVMSLLHAHQGDWEAAIAAFDADHQVNGLGVVTRGDRVEDLRDRLDALGVEPVDWYGVRLFTDGWVRERSATDPDALVLQAELEASRRDPYRHLSRLFHLIGRRHSAAITSGRSPA